MKDINENMDSFQSAGHSSSTDREPIRRTTKTPASAKGDYIDFEEIK